MVCISCSEDIFCGHVVMDALESKRMGNGGVELGISIYDLPVDCAAIYLAKI